MKTLSPNILPNLVAATFTSRNMQDRPRTAGYSKINSHHNDTKILKDGPEEDIMPTCFAPVFREPLKQEVSPRNEAIYRGSTSTSALKPIGRCQIMGTTII